MASELTKAEAIKRLYGYDVAPYLEYKERGGNKIPFVGLAASGLAQQVDDLAVEATRLGFGQLCQERV